MAQQCRACIALAEELSLIPSTNVGNSQVPVILASEDLILSSVLCDHYTPVYKLTDSPSSHIYTKFKIKINCLMFYSTMG